MMQNMHKKCKTINLDEILKLSFMQFVLLRFFMAAAAVSQLKHINPSQSSHHQHSFLDSTTGLNLINQKLINSNITNLIANRSTAATSSIIRNVLEKTNSMAGTMMSRGGVMSVPVEVETVPVPKEIEATVDSNENSNTSLEILVEDDGSEENKKTMKIENENSQSKKPKLDATEENGMNEVDIDGNVPQASNSLLNPNNVKNDYDKLPLFPKQVIEQALAEQELLKLERQQQQQVNILDQPKNDIINSTSLPSRIQYGGNLNDRFRLHAPPKVDYYGCDKCDILFKSQAMYMIHMGKHRAGRKPFVCNVCGIELENAIEFQCHFTRSCDQHIRETETHINL